MTQSQSRPISSIDSTLIPTGSSKTKNFSKQKYNRPDFLEANLNILQNQKIKFNLPKTLQKQVRSQSQKKNDLVVFNDGVKKNTTVHAAQNKYNSQLVHKQKTLQQKQKNKNKSSICQICNKQIASNTLDIIACKYCNARTHLFCLKNTLFKNYMCKKCKKSIKLDTKSQNFTTEIQIKGKQNNQSSKKKIQQTEIKKQKNRNYQKFKQEYKTALKNQSPDELVKKQKVQDNEEEIVYKRNNSSNIIQTKLATVQKRIDDLLVDKMKRYKQNKQKNVGLIKKLRNQYPRYFEKKLVDYHNYKIRFPIEDTLFYNQYSVIFDSYRNNIFMEKPIITQQLPSHFSVVLQLWTLTNTFSQRFPSLINSKSDRQISLWKLNNLIKQQKNRKNGRSNIQLLFIDLVNFICQDIIHKIQLSRQYMGNCFLCLIKYCTQNGMFNDIFPYLWVEVVWQLMEQGKNTMDQKQKKARELISNIRNIQIEDIDNKQRYYEFSPQNIEERVIIIEYLINSILMGDYYKEILATKIEKQRNRFQQRMKVYQQEIVKYEQLIKQNDQESTKIQNKLKQKSKMVDILKSLNVQQKIRENQKQIEKLIRKLKQKLQIKDGYNKKIMQAKKQMIKNGGINILFAMNSVTNSYFNTQSQNRVHFLGNDLTKRNYWFLATQGNKIFVQNIDQNGIQTWGYYNCAQMQRLMQSLNTKGVRQNYLYKNLSKLKKINLQELYTQQQIQTKPAKQIKSNEQQFFTENPFVFNYLKSILLKQQQKITNYLAQIKSAKWVSHSQRFSFNQFIRYANTIQDVVEGLKYFNQGIVIVQTDFFQKVGRPRKKQQQQDQQLQEDFYQNNKDILLNHYRNSNKARKIQTKIWGVNQKYKHSWFQYSQKCTTLIQLFALNSILCITIQKYVQRNKLKKRHFPNQDKLINTQKIMAEENDNGKNSKRGRKKIIKQSEQNTNENYALQKKKRLKKNFQSSSESHFKSSQQNKQQQQQQQQQQQNLQQSLSKTCAKCFKYGNLLACDFCPRLYHLKCIGLRHVPKQKYMCQKCLLSERSARSINRRHK